MGNITPQNITLTGRGAGLFYGIQTLIQLMPAERAATIKLPCAKQTKPRWTGRRLR
ncbi:MAG: hypothetical protein EOP04_28070 [Proteobacteria bacterium]|nr:MAG: hypothetical protein EOP04_28070 [Pseudomonadota bacterium]